MNTITQISFLRLFLGSFLTIIAVFSVCHADGECCTPALQENCCKDYRLGHRFLLGPEAVHIDRRREGGTKQDGWLPGVRFIYEHRRRYCLYCGVEASYARGTLRGHTGKNDRLKSRVTDATVEGRLGYAFQCKKWGKPEFTPFVGGGYIWEQNNLKDPSPLLLHTKINYGFAAVGFLSSISPNECLTIGLNAKIRYIFNPKCRITHDPMDGKGSTLKIGDDQLQYRIEVPITFKRNQAWGITAIPFYEQRFYGGKRDFPHDFVETRYYNYGATLALAYYY